MSAQGQATASLPVLRHAEKIRQYFLSRPISGLNKHEIKEELDHWTRLLIGRWGDEIAKRNNPGPKDDLLLWAGAVITFVGLAACFLNWIVGFSIAVAGYCLTIYQSIDYWLKIQRDEELYEPVRLAVQRGEALIQELEKRS